jgi:hypothetical protein
VLIGVVALCPLIAAVWFSERASLARAVRGEVSSDGFTVSFPAKVFPWSVVAAHESSPRAPTGSSGATYVPLH